MRVKLKLRRMIQIEKKNDIGIARERRFEFV